MLKHAVTKVQQRHVLLRVRIKEDNEHALWFTSEGVQEIPFEIVPRKSENDWIKIHAEASKIPFEFETHPAIRFVLVQSPDVSELIILCHHMICDGMSLAHLAREHDVKRFIFASTCSVYGLGTEDLVDEGSAPNPISLYAETKLDAEKQLSSLISDKVILTNLRFGTAYGLSPRMRFDLVVNFFAKKAALGEEMKIFGGNQWRPFVHVQDIANAIVLTLEAPEEKVSNEVFNVGTTKENHKISAMGDILEECIPGVKINRITEVEDKRSYRVSFKKIEETLGFTNTKTIKDSFLEIKKAIDNGTIRDLEHDKYSNVRGMFGKK